MAKDAALGSLSSWLIVLTTAMNAVMLGLLVYIVTRLFPRSRGASKGSEHNVHHAGDSKHTCGALDPVSEPAYNMREIAKQSILLEEHLVERAKYCRDCIAKHFLHIIGLAEEAQMLACDNAPRYPLLNESVEFYKAEMDAWQQVSAEEPEAASEQRLRIAGELRAFRKKLVAAYVLT